MSNFGLSTFGTETLVNTGETLKMSNFTEHHGITLAKGSYIERLVAETLAVAPTGDEAIVARQYYDPSVNALKFVKFDSATNQNVVNEIATNEALVATKTLLENAIAQAIADLKGGVDPAWDTLQELAQQDTLDQTAIVTALTNAVTALKGGVSVDYDTLKKIEDAIVALQNATSNANSGLRSLLDQAVTDLLSKVGTAFGYMTSYLNGKHYAYRATEAKTTHTIVLPIAFANGGTDINTVVLPELGYTHFVKNADGSFESIQPSKTVFNTALDATSGKVQLTVVVTFSQARQIQTNFVSHSTQYAVDLGTITLGTTDLTGTVTPTVVA